MRMTFREYLDFPLDGYHKFIDGRPIFGHTKTIRGVLSSLLMTTLIAMIIGTTAVTGALIAFYAMLGDLLSSFIKRRLGMASSKMALGLDQIPESLLPLMAVNSYFEITWSEMLIVMSEFFILELVFSHLYIRYYLKTSPY
jgi:CDP-2,3-bis-(O-geranylgeranyl)-sn-glycerol synthase